MGQPTSKADGAAPEQRTASGTALVQLLLTILGPPIARSPHRRKALFTGCICPLINSWGMRMQHIDTTRRSGGRGGGRW